MPLPEIWVMNKYKYLLVTIKYVALFLFLTKFNHSQKKLVQAEKKNFDNFSGLAR